MVLVHVRIYLLVIMYVLLCAVFKRACPNNNSLQNIYMYLLDSIIIWAFFWLVLNFIFVTFCSGRYGGWHSRETQANVQKNVPRVLVYIMGGMTFSEFRVGYEITNDRKNWEVIVGKLLFLFFKSLSKFLHMIFFFPY